MVLDAVSNFVRGSTDASIDDTATTLSVVDASVFPDPASDGEYNVVVWDAAQYPRPDQDPDVEVLRVTAVDTGTDDLTVTRGQEGTSGASHPSGSAVHLSPTAKMFSDIEDTFGDFWDADEQELTADVNNDAVSTGEIDNILFVRSGDDPQTVINDSPTNGSVWFDSTVQHERTSTLSFNTAGLTVLGLPRVRWADGAVSTGEDKPLVEVNADDVTIPRIATDGNKTNQSLGGDTYAGDFRIWGCQDVEVGLVKSQNSCRHGCVVTGTDSAVSSVTVETVIARNPRRDGASVESSATDIEIESVRVFSSETRGGVEVVDGAQHVEIGRVYAEDSAYAVDFQTHSIAAVEDVTVGAAIAENCDHAIDVGESSNRHKDISIENVRYYGDGAVDGIPIIIKSVDGLEIGEAIVEDVGDQEPFAIVDCSEVTVRKARIRGNGNVPSGMVIRDSDDVLVENAHVTGAYGSGIWIDETDGGTHEAIAVTDGIVQDVQDGVEITDDTGTLDYYRVQNMTIQGASGSDINDSGSGANKDVSTGNI